MPEIPSYRIFASSQSASTALAEDISQLIRSRDSEERTTVLGLATGNTPIQLYKELIRMHRDGLSFRNVVTFNLDEYIGINREHPESYWQFMHSHLFNHIDINPENIHIPEGMVAADDIESHCSAYENHIEEAGGIDLQVLGIGRNGHIGFNEPGVSPDVATHATELNQVTIHDAADAFGGAARVPQRAITMGVKTILGAQRIALLAFGSSKADIVKRALTPGITSEVPATYLQSHNDTTFFLDQDAGKCLS